MNGASPTMRLSQLAKRIQEDIAARNLKPGDAYLTPAQTAQLLKVSGNAANKALQLLAQRRVLIRRQRSGTVIAAPPEDLGPLHRIHLLVHRNYLKTEGLLADGVVLGIQSQLPGADIQFNFMPSDRQEEVRHLHRLADEAVRATDPEGFVLVRSTFEAQQILADSGLPTVVFGKPYPSIDLSWIDRDRKRSEQLLAEHLISRGCTQIGLLWRQQVLASDPDGLDAVGEVLTQNDLPASALHVRCLPANEQVVQATICEMVGRTKGKWGFICRSQPLADAAAGVAMPRRSIHVVASDVYPKASQPIQLAHVRTVAGPQSIGAEIGRLLVARCRTGEPRGKTLAVELAPAR
jgi:DNA-binding LacI/PurR family transcriptional regulator